MIPVFFPPDGSRQFGVNFHMKRKQLRENYCFPANSVNFVISDFEK